MMFLKIISNQYSAVLFWRRVWSDYHAIALVINIAGC